MYYSIYYFYYENAVSIADCNLLIRKMLIQLFIQKIYLFLSIYLFL